MSKRSPIYAILVWLLGIVPVLAQATSCPTLVEEALVAVGDNCAQLSRNSACYGFNRVDATFTSEFPDGYFSIPADRANLAELDTLRTVPMNSSNGEWGVAVMNIQANLPNTLPGQGVIMMLVGDAEVRNDVPMTEANEIVDPLSTVTIEETTVYTSPAVTANMLSTLAENEIVLIDGYNPTKMWLRAVNDGVVGWVKNESVARLAAMDMLPIVGSSHPSPMQAFYLSTGIGVSECSDADSVIAVQSPENIKVDLTVNGVDIKVGSLVTFQNMDVSTLNLTVHRGEVTTIFGNAIGAGQSAIAVMNNTDGDSNPIFAWSDGVPASEEDLQLGNRVQNGINNLARSNGWNERQIDPNNNASGEIIHIVQQGESLYGIGRLYDTSLPEIVARNGLSAPFTLFTGQELVIPNPGSGFVGLPASAFPPAPPPPVGEESTTSICDTLRLTSPLTSAPSESVPYYWDGVSGATQYQINIFDYATGKLIGSFLTPDAQTHMNISIGDLGVGGSMQWEVIAILNGQPICTTGLSQPLTHSAPEGPPPEIEEGKDDFSISWGCEGYYELKVKWENANDNDRIDFVIKDDGGNIYNVQKQGESGSLTISGIGYTFTSVVATTSSGEEDSKKGRKDCYLSGGS